MCPQSTGKQDPHSYKIPEDISVIGFDNISESRIIEPSLTTIDVPRHHIGTTAAKLLIEQIGTKVVHPSKVEISTRMVKRFSVLASSTIPL